MLRNGTHDPRTLISVPIQRCRFPETGDGTGVHVANDSRISHGRIEGDTMTASSRLTLSEVRAAMRLVGECRDLGREPQQWLAHLTAGLSRLVGSRVVVGLITEGGFSRHQTIRQGVLHGFDAPFRTGRVFDLYGRKNAIWPT